MRIDTFNKPSHSDITSTCEIFKSLDEANFVSFYLLHFVFICTFLHLTISILLVSFLCHRHFVFLTLAVKLFSNGNAGSEI